ncbi:MAG: 4'-phosphopantetheinyl transferase superfamily protein [Firmicutes bacterium]|nr:4'-phosphopantetheinyl transferase superfamily protein [Bacillota bacterium]
MIKLYFTEIENSKLHSDHFVKNLLAEFLCVDSDSLVICKNGYGKPYLRDYPDIHYNVSHTKGAIVCALADEPVGVDIERIKRFNKHLVEHFFTKDEQKYIYAGKTKQEERFAEIWTKKEAYVKWIGKGMELPFHTFSVLQKEELSILQQGIYYIAVCTNKCNNNIQVIEVGEE